MRIIERIYFFWLRPRDTSYSRRRVLSRIIGGFGKIALLSFPMVSVFFSPRSVASGETVGSPALPTGTQQFLVVSRAITGRTDLGLEVAIRIYKAMLSQDPSFEQVVSGFFSVAKRGGSPNDMLDAAVDSGHREAILTIVAAWYTGTVGKGEKAKLIIYKDALMYRPVQDGLTVPTYCTNGPLWWTGPVPLAMVSAPKVREPAAPARPPVNRNG